MRIDKNSCAPPGKATNRARRFRGQVGANCRQTGYRYVNISYVNTGGAL
ncbi:MAG TPA: hypothetical protein VHY84_24490 [Bryobacteraceae bacterium]|nr:hypothetical protein [Bryobacteraceae bacterium]